MAQDVAIRIYKAGDGFSYPKPGQIATIHYTGTVKGKKFDSTRDRGKPFSFQIGAEQVFPGKRNHRFMSERFTSFRWQIHMGCLLG